MATYTLKEIKLYDGRCIDGDVTVTVDRPRCPVCGTPTRMLYAYKGSPTAACCSEDCATVDGHRYTNPFCRDRGTPCGPETLEELRAQREAEKV